MTYVSEANWISTLESHDFWGESEGKRACTVMWTHEIVHRGVGSLTVAKGDKFLTTRSLATAAGFNNNERFLVRDPQSMHITALCGKILIRGTLGPG